MDVSASFLVEDHAVSSDQVVVDGTYEDLSALAGRIAAASKKGLLDPADAERITYSMYLDLHRDKSAGTVQELRDLAARFQEMAREGSMDPQKCRAASDAIASACEGRHLNESPMTVGEMQEAIMRELLRLRLENESA